MNYQDFKHYILSALQDELGTDVRITIQDVIKNNNTHLDGLTIFSNRHNLSPTIYLNYYFHAYEKGRSLPDILDDILSIYQKNVSGCHIDVSFFTDYDKVKSRIIMKLVNYERNRELLADVPHYRYLDLAIIFNCLLESASEGNATILIYNHHLSYWNVTRDDLYALALCNTPRLLTYDLRNMTDVLHELLSSDDAPPLTEDITGPCAMYVLSNHHKLNGSVCILYPNLLKDFAGKLCADFYILPSSVHEVLLIPACNEVSYQELSAMVKEVNASQLSREEILSDHVYYFSRESGQITM